MLPKKARLGATEVREILKTGRSARVGGVSAKYVEASDARAAVVVSKKTAKTAVARNALRRRIYTTLDKTLPSRKHVVFFIQTNPFKTDDLVALCSRLS